MKTERPSARPLPLGSSRRLLRPLDAGAISETIHGALAAAGLDSQSGPLKRVSDTIRRALSSAGLGRRFAPDGDCGAPPDGTARESDASRERNDDVRAQPRARAGASGPGEFVGGSFTNHAGTRAYKLYVPASCSSESSGAVPLVVMLHGCTQSPDDFAAGTRMNALADEHGFLVLYPAQAANANGARCWNWFQSNDQVRDRGEPALIAGITRKVASSQRVDERRIFIAGLSAGAAMAVVMGATYPELYAAVGAHSGLPYGAAHDMPSAFAAMKGGRALAGMPGLPGTATARRPQVRERVPTIVFHGDRDTTVHACNGAAIVEQATAGSAGEARLRASVQEGVASGGRSYRRTVYLDVLDRAVVELWELHGAGHAWSGGSASGSFTDASGPDASAEMIRFFFSQHRAGAA